MAAGFGVHHEWGKLREVIIGISPAEDFVVFHEESMRWQAPAEAEFSRKHAGRRLIELDRDWAYRIEKQADALAELVAREGVTIHRSSGPGSATVVGSGCFIMAYAHVAHDDRLADGVILANNVALAGHVEIEERAFLSGGVVVHQFCRIGRLAMIGGNSKIVQDCLPFIITDGVPGEARGLNVVGLRRAGVPASQLRPLKEAYRLLLRAALPLETALARLSAIEDPLVDELVAFVRRSRRGFHRAGRTDDV